MDARTVVETNRARLREAEERIRNHRYVKAIRAGALPKDALLDFAGHQFFLANSDIRSAAILVGRFGDTPSGTFFNTVLQGELAAREGIIVLAGALGMSREDLVAYEPDAAGVAYGMYMTWISTFGSAAEVASGMLVNLAAWGHNCGEMSQGLREHYGLTRDDTAFLDAFANLPPIEDVAGAIIQNGLDNGVSAERIYRASRLFQAYEEMFWDTLARLAGG